MQWFDVDKAGLAKVLAPKARVRPIRVLVQNAWDEDTSKLLVTVAAHTCTRYAQVKG